MAFKSPIATTAQHGVMRVGAGLTSVDGLVSTNPVALFDQGYFYDTTTQTNPVASVVNLTSFDSLAVNVGITLVAGTQLTVSKTANYNLQFSVQLDKTSGPQASVDIWLRKNGIADYPDTNTSLVLIGSNAVLLAGWSYLLALNAGDYVEIAWQSPDTTVRLLAKPTQVGPTRPVTPSARCTIVQL